MRTFRTARNGSFAMGPDGNIDTVVGQTATIMVAENFAKTQLGEMIHAMDTGIPFFDTVFAASPNIVQYEAALRIRLMQVPSVEAITVLDVRQVEDRVEYTATLRQRTGEEITVNG